MSDVQARTQTIALSVQVHCLPYQVGRRNDREGQDGHGDHAANHGCRNALHGLRAGPRAQRIRLDCVSEANHNLNRLLDEPEGGIMDGPEKTARKAP